MGVSYFNFVEILGKLVNVFFMDHGGTLLKTSVNVNEGSRDTDFYLFLIGK